MTDDVRLTIDDYSKQCVFSRFFFANGKSIKSNEVYQSSLPAPAFLIVNPQLRQFFSRLANAFTAFSFFKSANRYFLNNEAALPIVNFFNRQSSIPRGKK
jgi:hypothetical protein